MKSANLINADLHKNILNLQKQINELKKEMESLKEQMKNKKNLGWNDLPWAKHE